MSIVEPSYEELAALVARLAARLEQANARVAALEVELAALRSRLGKNSTNSSAPPSKDSIGAKAEQKAKRGKARSQRVRSKARKRGGQPGHQGFGLTPAEEPDRTETVQAPAECADCGGDLCDGIDAGYGWAQVWDILPVVLQKVHYLLSRRTCAGCGKVSTAVAPFGQAGTVCYGPNVNAAAIVLSSQANVPVEATAALMGALLGTEVSTGFVARAHQRFADLLASAGFDEAMIAALRAEDVLCADETPVNVVANVEPDGRSADGSPHVVTVRTPDARLVWYKAIAARTSANLAKLGVFNSWGGILVRDDYAGYHQFDANLAGVQQCGAHLIRHLQGVLDPDPLQQQWAAQVQKSLRDAAGLVDKAKATNTPIDAEALAVARTRYDQGVRVGISVNLSRPWPKGNHPGLVLARRLQTKAEQVWLFTTNPQVPWTNNSSEQALKSPKLHQKVSGYWQTTITLNRFTRVRSYLVTTRNYGIQAIDAIRAVLNGNPWLPTPATSTPP